VARHLVEEGGGVLMNQAPHNIDLMLWNVGHHARTVRLLSFR
jgi:predicted dehydrogenase